MLAGGCLCGAVRWEAPGPTLAVHHCHCGMCRRWTGAAFATLVWLPKDGVQWAGTEPVVFRSSPIATRSHCGRCGTPIALVYDARDDIGLAAGTLDDPEAVRPTHHYGVESRLSWVDTDRALPEQPTRETW